VSISWLAELIPIQVRPYVRTFGAAGLAGEQRLQIGQPDIIGPSVSANCRQVAALVVGAIDQETTNASGAHLCEGDFLLAGESGHAPFKRGQNNPAIHFLSLAMKRGKSVDFTGYWQRHIAD
jgi:hypothetical protein